MTRGLLHWQAASAKVAGQRSADCASPTARVDGRGQARVQGGGRARRGGPQGTAKPSSAARAKAERMPRQISWPAAIASREVSGAYFCDCQPVPGGPCNSAASLMQPERPLGDCHARLKHPSGPRSPRSTSRRLGPVTDPQLASNQAVSKTMGRPTSSMREHHATTRELTPAHKRFS